MKKKQHDSEIWKKQWFRKLSLEGKIVYLYIKDNVDCSGCYTIDTEKVKFETGIDNMRLINEIKGLEKKLFYIPSDCILCEGKDLDSKIENAILLYRKIRAKNADGLKFYVKNYLDFHYNLPSTFNTNSLLHQNIIKRLTENNLDFSAIDIIENKKNVRARVESTLRIRVYKNKQTRNKNKEKKREDARGEKQKPEYEEVKQFERERVAAGYPAIDIEKFFAHYQANGWVQGSKNIPIEDWKAQVVKWESGKEERQRAARVKEQAKKKESEERKPDPEVPGLAREIADGLKSITRQGGAAKMLYEKGMVFSEKKKCNVDKSKMEEIGGIFYEAYTGENYEFPEKG